MLYGGTNVSLFNNTYGTTQSNTTFGIGAGGWNSISTIGQAGIGLWGSIAMGNITSEMQKDLMDFNNRMRAIAQAQRQYAADVNRAAVTDQHMQEDVQISLDRMRAESQVATEGAFLGASSSARKAAMFDINRNAVQAKFMSQSNFESTLEQIQMQENGDNFNAIQAFQNPSNIQLPSVGTAIFSGVAGLVNKSISSGAWDKGSKLNTLVTNLFGGGSSVQLPG